MVIFSMKRVSILFTTLCVLSCVKSETNFEDVRREIDGIGVCREGPFGGGGGSHFTDEGLGLVYDITAIRISFSNSIYSIQTTYGPVVGSRRGYHQGNSEAVIHLAPGEFIWGIEGRSGREVDHLTFFSNIRSYGPYGGTGGDQFFSYRSYPPTMQNRLRWFAGKANDRLDALEFYFQC